MTPNYLNPGSLRRMLHERAKASTEGVKGM